MALTEAHRKWRAEGIGGSDARAIASCKAGAWIALKNEKVHGIEPVFTRQQLLLMALGTAAEPIILDYLHDNVVEVAQRNIPFKMVADSYFRCTLDGLTKLGHPVQCKFHTGDKSLEELSEYYWPQLQHEMLVTAQPRLVLAVVFGHWGRFEHMAVEQDRSYQDHYMARALEFKAFCWNDAALPTDIERDDAAAPVPDIPRLRDHVWPTSDNAISVLAADWINNAAAAEAYKNAGDGLKKAVPDDARSATWSRDGIGIRITVNKAGAKSIKPWVGRA